MINCRHFAWNLKESVWFKSEASFRSESKPGPWSRTLYLKCQLLLKKGYEWLAMISERNLDADDDKFQVKWILGKQPHQIFFRGNQAPGTGSRCLRLNIFQILRRVAMMIRKFQKAADIEAEAFNGCLKFRVACDAGETKDRFFFQSVDDFR